MEKYEQPRVRLVSKVPTKEFKDNYEAIFGKKEGWLDRKEREAEMQEKSKHDSCEDDFCCGKCSPCSGSHTDKAYD